MGVVEGASLVYDANIDKLVLNMTTFPAAHHPYDKSLPPRASAAEPTCSLHYGLARVNETVANIGHLSDVANATCSVPAATCARVSHEGGSSIFFCNFVCGKDRKRHIQIIDMSVQESHPIDTTCGDLIEPAKQISDACRMGNRYTYGYVSRNIVDGSQTYPYLVAIGDDYAFEP
ncbi:hypothetical protein CNMCM6106_005489 [Aspergillus hiratsukae]|uniref:Uncharacterized protein n=1 Tax=Aspergillus hiratsukae TaxID=1194566 RepID=A0A8H6UXM6_9EURO|nr:hypothetical protein CNMCM6106_005489 [Aspergillus hiratsukae]